MAARKRGTALIVMTLVITSLLFLAACSRISQAPQEFSGKSASSKLDASQPAYAIRTEIRGGSVVLTTSAAEFQVSPDGYVQAFLLKDGNKLSLDEPNVGAPAGSNFVSVAGKNVNFTLDLEHAKVTEAVGKMGSGKRIEISARPLGAMGKELHAVLSLEVYDNFPNILLSTRRIQEHGRAGLRHRQKRESATPVRCAVVRSESASLGIVVISRCQLRLGKRRCRSNLSRLSSNRTSWEKW